MAASTRSRPRGSARFGRAATPPSGRFGRPATPRPRVNVRKRQPQPSGVGKLLQGLTKKKSGTSRGKGAGAKAPAGAALLFSAAGLAFKNRDKLTSMLGRKDADAGVQPVAAGIDTAESQPVPLPPQNSAAASGPIG
jgi:hypothetical protein